MCRGHVHQPLGWTILKKALEKSQHSGTKTAGKSDYARGELSDTHTRFNPMLPTSRSGKQPRKKNRSQRTSVGSPWVVLDPELRHCLKCLPCKKGILCILVEFQREAPAILRISIDFGIFWANPQNGLFLSVLGELVALGSALEGPGACIGGMTLRAWEFKGPPEFG